MKLTLHTLTLVTAATAVAQTAQFANDSVTPALSCLPPITTSAPSDCAVTWRGPHSRVWQSTTWVTNTLTGRVGARRSGYTEVATGMARLVNGQWIDCNPNLEITATGAQATNTQHSVAFLGNINTWGAVDLTTPEGLHLTSNPLCLQYEDNSGATAIIAPIQDSLGQLLPSGHEALYPNALSGNGVTASMLYINSISGFEQIAILQTQLPDPASFGLDPSSTLLDLVTEFLTPPTPIAIPSGVDEDQNLDFGIMKMIRGEAFALGSETNRIPVVKQWLQQGGRVFLLEKVPLSLVQSATSDLPLPATAAKPRDLKSLPNLARNSKFPDQRQTRKDRSPLEIATAPLEARGFALDYNIVTSQTNAVFQADTTYYVSSSGVVLSGSNVFEGGTVIKFATNTSINIYPTATTPTATFLGSQYRPIVCTAKDDNSVGDAISGSTGTPAGYYANPALYFAGISPAVPVLNYLRFAFAYQGIGLQGVSANVSHAQFVNCQNGLVLGGSTAHLRNVLFASTLTNVLATSGAAVTVENGTSSGASLLESAPSYNTGSTLSFTNCILANVTNITAGLLTLTGSFNGFYNSSTFGNNALSTSSNPLQTAGAGSAYQSDGSPFRNTGTTNIDVTLLEALTNGSVAEFVGKSV